MQKNINKITILSGDGIGPEVIAQGLKVLEVIRLKYGHRGKLMKH